MQANKHIWRGVQNLVPRTMRAGVKVASLSQLMMCIQREDTYLCVCRPSSFNTTCHITKLSQDEVTFSAEE